MLDKKIQEALAIMGYTKLMPIQEAVIPALLKEENVVVKARTGSGKTASFAIPICEKIDWDENNPQALILTCTRELAQQIQEEVSLIGRLKKIKVQSIIGKEKMQYQVDSLKQKTHIVVATPGRLWDHLQNGTIDVSKVRYVVLDEADYMLDMGFIEQVDAIFEYLPKALCISLFSATYPTRIQALVEKRIKEPVFIEHEEKAEIEHYMCVKENIEESFLNILKQTRIESALVFCDTQVDVDDLYLLCRKKGINVAKLHGGMLQNKRFEALQSFKEGKTRILVATDVAARGIDIENVTHVIHYQLPHTLEEYTHRCGRTGRKDRSGISILLVEDTSASILKVLQKNFTIEKWKQTEVFKDYAQLKQKVTKEAKQDKWQDTVIKLYVGAGKDKKVRANDIIGAFCSVEGVGKEDIGVINVLQKMSYVEILHAKESLLVEAFKEKTIKNKKVKVQVAKSS